ncbi:MAG: putative membrane protein YphA (DoxX/SURF4 family) [Arenicella sp.]|jgi:uncharacterized membrane protein YphA (DoxX/SURF4 family)
MIEPKKLVQVELISRWVMALILLTAGTSKLFSAGGFKTYYLGLFTNDALRLNPPADAVELYLAAIPFIELSLGAALLVSALKRYTIYAWYVFMASLLVGHYLLQEWSSVNQMLGYFFLGMICHLLPTKNEL